MMFCKSFDECKKIRNLTNIGMAKLVTTLPSNPFTKWRFDFVGPINPVG
jgi:hypothetical protein